MTVREAAEIILGSKKYSGMDRAVAERICAEKISGYKKPDEIIKSVKNELHIINESFLPSGCHKKAQALLDNYRGDLAADREFAVRLMELHASTKERLGEVSEIYASLGRYIEAKDVVYDLGCGFGPFALPFYPEKPNKYFAFDINTNTVEILESYFSKVSLDYHAQVLDAAVQNPDAGGSVLLMLKLFPLLEHQKKGRSFEIIKSAGCSKIVVSFPTKSASGREKGMEAFYSAQFEENLPQGLVIAEKKIFKNEMFYFIKLTPKKLTPGY
ncbi:MAG: hypothetical protein FWF22_04100 [Treponema sp.]|nr:hypothetical protein [Treponema sp.]